MGETEEFAEALLDQIAVELNEEKEILNLSTKISDISDFPKNFTNMEDFSEENFPIMLQKIHDFTGLDANSNIRIEYPDLKEFKLLKGKKVYATIQSSEFVNDLFSAVADESVEDISNLIQKDTKKFLVIQLMLNHTYLKSQQPMVIILIQLFF